MVVVGAVSGLIFLTVCAVIGIRLLLLARRTRQAPELAFGSALALMVLVGTPIAVLASIPDLLSPEWGARASVLSMVFIEAGVLCIFAFTWQVFRAESAIARRVMAVIAVLLAMQVLGTGYTGLGAANFADYFERTRGWSIFHHLMLAGAFGWSAVESLMYHAALRRRLELGLAEPVIADRFRLWGWMGVSSSVMNAINTVCLMAGLNILTHPVPQLSTAACGMFSAAFLYLAFLPPEWYLRRVERRSQTTHA